MPQPLILSWGRLPRMRQAIVAVPITSLLAVPCRVIVPVGQDGLWTDRAITAAAVTVEAVRVRLANQLNH